MAVASAEKAKLPNSTLCSTCQAPRAKAHPGAPPWCVQQRWTFRLIPTVVLLVLVVPVVVADLVPQGLLVGRSARRAGRPPPHRCPAGDNAISAEGACALSDALKANTTLTELNLTGEQAQEQW